MKATTILLLQHNISLKTVYPSNNIFFNALVIRVFFKWNNLKYCENHKYDEIGT